MFTMVLTTITTIWGPGLNVEGNFSKETFFVRGMGVHQGVCNTGMLTLNT